MKDLKDSALIYNYLKAELEDKGHFSPTVKNIEVEREPGKLKLKCQYHDYHNRSGSHESETTDLDLIAFGYESLTDRVDQLEPADKSSKYY